MTSNGTPESPEPKGLHLKRYIFSRQKCQAVTLYPAPYPQFQIPNPWPHMQEVQECVLELILYQAHRMTSEHD